MYVYDKRKKKKYKGGVNQLYFDNSVYIVGLALMHKINAAVSFFIQ